MWKIVDRYTISADFLHVLCSFGGAPLPTESGSSNLVAAKAADGSSGTSFTKVGSSADHLHSNLLLPTPVCGKQS